MTKPRSADGPLVHSTCQDCGTEFEYNGSRFGGNGRVRSFCQPCVRKHNSAHRMQVYRDTRGEADRKYRQSHPEVYSTATSKWRKANPDKITAYNATEKGRQVRRNQDARNNARRRCDDFQSYTARRNLMYRDQQPCDWCGAPFTGTHQIDHAFPLAMARLIGIKSGLDDWANLEVLCQACHEWKSRRDQGDILRMRKQLTGSTRVSDSEIRLWPVHRSGKKVS